MNEILKRIKFAVDFLEKQELKGMTDGKYPVNDWFYFNLQEYITNAEPEAKMEAHRKYVDIQYIVSGREMINVAQLSGLEELVPYDEEKDIGFWRLPERSMNAVLGPGSYIVLLPENAHQPGVAAGSPAEVKKAVGKVYIGDLV